jgi:hypothetical protein
MVPGAANMPPTVLSGSLPLIPSGLPESPALHVPTARRADTALQDLADQFVWHRVWLQPPHRPGGPHDLEQIGGVRGCVRRSLLGHASSRVADRNGAAQILAARRGSQ